MDASPDPGILPEIEIALLLLILLINGLLTAVDKAIESVNRNNIREMAADGSKRAVRLVKIFDDSKRFMPKVKGKADGNAVRKIIEDFLG